MTNLLEETIKILNTNNKTIDDVKWIGCKEFKLPIEKFKKLFNIKYDSGFGLTYIAQDLLIVGDDWWLERHEYDGSEWWEYKSLPIEPKEIKDINKIMDYERCYVNLSELI